MAKQPKIPPLAHIERRGANDVEEWKLAAARTSRRKWLEVPLQNHFNALQTEEERPITSAEPLELGNAALSAPCMTNSTTKKRQWVIVVGNSLLKRR